ncbi:MAG: outer membrane beta-barrel protein [Terriglobia bacterium]|jgi:outer membrane protein W
MMTKKTVQGLMVAAALCFSTVAAHARDLSFDVFVMGSGSTLFDTRYFGSADEKYRSSYATAVKYVVGVEVPLGKILGVEAAYASGPNDLRVTNISLNPTVTTVYGVRNNVGSVDLVAHAPFSRFGFRPYLAVGWDYHRFAPTLVGKTQAESQGFGAVSTATLVATNKLGVNCGGGVEHKISRRVSFRLDVRDHLTGSPTFGLPAQAPTGAIFPVSGLAQNVVYSAGIVVHFGKKK